MSSYADREIRVLGEIRKQRESYKQKEKENTKSKQISKEDIREDKESDSFYRLFLYTILGKVALDTTKFTLQLI